MKSYTDLEQSEKLAEILPPESADMCYQHFVTEFFKEGYCPSLMKKEEDDDVPCWSLAALLGILPILERKGYQKAKPLLLYNVAINKWIVDSHVYTTDSYDNPVDACYEMILKLHELKDCNYDTFYFKSFSSTCNKSRSTKACKKVSGKEPCAV